MDTIYILSNVYTSENCAKMEGTKLFSMYPSAAGTKEDVEEDLAYHIKNAEAEGCLVEEITSEDIHAGQYFDRVVRIQSKHGGPYIYGISTVLSRSYLKKY